MSPTFDPPRDWSPIPIFGVLVAGLVGGAAMEMAANADRDVPTSVEYRVTVTEASAPEVPPEVEVIPPPPPPEPREPERVISEAPTFTPFTVAPSILNRDEVVQAMADAYPAELREDGIGGTARVFFFVSDDGTVEDVRLDQSSGIPALDEAALSVAQIYRFSPALNRDERVPVWVSFPITFRVR